MLEDSDVRAHAHVHVHGSNHVVWGGLLLALTSEVVYFHTI